MLQSAIAIVCGRQHEHIAVEWWLGISAMPEGHFGLADALGIGQQAFTVERWTCTGDNTFMGNASRGERASPERPHLDGCIHQRVVVGSAVGAKPVGVDFQRCETRGQLPVGLQSRRGGVSIWCRENRELMWPVFAANHTQAQAGAIEKATL